MVWLWLVGSLKLYVSFAEYSLFYRALLQKSSVILRSLHSVAIPYQSQMSQARLIHTVNMPMTWLMHICRIHNSFLYTMYQRHDSFISVSGTTHACMYYTKGMPHSLSITYTTDSCTRYANDVTHSYLSQTRLVHARAIPRAWLTHMCHSQNSFIYMTCQRHDSFISVADTNLSCTWHTQGMPLWVWHIWVTHMCHIHNSCVYTTWQWHDSFIRVARHQSFLRAACHWRAVFKCVLQHSALHYNTLQHTLQHTASHIHCKRRG